MDFWKFHNILEKKNTLNDGYRIHHPFPITFIVRTSTFVVHNKSYDNLKFTKLKVNLKLQNATFRTYNNVNKGKTNLNEKWF